MCSKDMTSLVRSASFRTEVKDVLAMFGRDIHRERFAHLMGMIAAA
jgi:hypothetical protein